MPKHYWLYDAHRDFHVTMTDPAATILDACRAVERLHGVLVQGYQVARSEARSREEAVIV